jgi:hypothetical protein
MNEGFDVHSLSLSEIRVQNGLQLFHSLFRLEDVWDGTRGAELRKRIRHVDKRGVDAVGGKGEKCGALGDAQ